MKISHKHICTLRNKVASLKYCRNSFICEREAFYSLIFRLFASQSSDCCLPVSGLSQSAEQTERDKPVMGTLSLVNQYCQPMREYSRIDLKNNFSLRRNHSRPLPFLTISFVFLSQRQSLVMVNPSNLVSCTTSKFEFSRMKVGSNWCFLVKLKGMILVLVKLSVHTKFHLPLPPGTG